MSYYNETIPIEGILWKLKSSFTGNKKWKKCWVTLVIKEKKKKTDDQNKNNNPQLQSTYHASTKIRLYQYSEAYKPSIMSGKKPKYTVDMKDCTLINYPLHPYSFVLTERSSKTTLVFGCEDPKLYDEWMKHLSDAFGIIKLMEELKISDDEEEIDNNKSILLKSKSKAFNKIESLKSDELSMRDSIEGKKSLLSSNHGSIEDVEQQEEDSIEALKDFNLVYRYFRMQNIFKKEKENPYIVIEEDLEILLYDINPSFDIEVIVHLIKLDLHLESENIISYVEFYSWWKSNMSKLGLPLEPIYPPVASIQDTVMVRPRVLLDQNHTDTMHLLGFIDNSPARIQSFRSSKLLNMNLVHSCPTITRSYIDAFYESKKNDSVPTITNGSTNNSNSGWNHDYQTYSSVLAITKIPVDEGLQAYPTNEIEKELEHEFQNAEGDNNDNTNEEKDIEHLNPHSPRKSSLQVTVTSEKTKKKIHLSNSNPQELNELSEYFTALTNFCHLKGSFYETVVQDVQQIIDDYSLPNHLKKIKLSTSYKKNNLNSSNSNPSITQNDDIYESSGIIYYLVDSSSNEDDSYPTEERLDQIYVFDETNRKRASNEFRNTCYVSKHTSSSLNESFTTMLSVVIDYAGFRMMAICPVSFDKNNLSLVYGSRRIETNGPTPLEIFVDSLGSTGNISQGQLVSELARNLNLQMYERTYRTSRSESKKVNVITHELQIHRGNDDKLYITNLASLLPVDFPRAHSYDVFTKQLRPEYVSKSNHSFYADLLQTNIEDVEGNLHVDEGLWAEAIAHNLAHNGALYQQLLPRLATMLDSCAVMFIDSYGFTEWIHRNGVNCRHIGVLLSLCTSTFSKLLLLSEAIARSCKSLLNSELRKITRKCYGDNLRAMHRNRSQPENYLELKEDLLNKKRKDIVVNIFNLTLGCGDSRDEFWNGPLSDALFYKFGIEATSTYLLSQVHLPQVFIAMQYHLSIRYKDEAIYNMNTPGVTEPFTAQNIIEHVIPSLPTLSASLIPGPTGIISSLIDSYIVHGLYEHASKALGLQYFTESAITSYSFYEEEKWMKISIVHRYHIAHILYKIVLSLYLSQDYAMALEKARLYLSVYPNYHPITGRILSLLMCIEWNLGNVEKAQLYFDAAQEIYNYTLGSSHPILIYHIHCFATLYSALPNRTGYHQGKLLLLLAYAKAKQALGEAHVVTAIYQTIVAELYINEIKHKSAIDLLVNSSNIFINASKTTKNNLFIKDSIRALYGLAVCYNVVGNYIEATETLRSCISIYNPLQIREYGWNDNIHYIHLSSLLLLSDVYLQINETKESLNALANAWDVINQIKKVYPSYQRSSIEKIMSRLVKKSFALLLNALNMSTRSLFDSIILEWKQQQVLQHHNDPQQSSTIDTNVIVAIAHEDNDMNNKLGISIDLQKHVLNMIWELGPFQYFALIIDGLEKHELAPNDNDNDDNENIGMGDHTESVLIVVPLAVQAMMISILANEIVTNEEEVHHLKDEKYAML